VEYYARNAMRVATRVACRLRRARCGRAFTPDDTKLRGALRVRQKAIATLPAIEAFVCAEWWRDGGGVMVVA